MAIKRKLDVELSAIIGLIHDIGKIASGRKEGHAKEGYIPARNLLKKVGCFSEEEIELISNAVKNHSSKDEVGSWADEIAKDVEGLEMRMTELLEDDDENYKNGPKTFIGKKSPLIRHEQITTIFDIFEINDNRVLFATFGPRRMDYRKNFKVFLTLRNAFKNYE